MIKLDGHEVWTSRGVSVLCHIGRQHLLDFLRKVQVLTKQNAPAPLVFGKDMLLTGRKTLPTGQSVATTYWTVKGLAITHELIKKGLEEKLIPEAWMTHTKTGVDEQGKDIWTPKKKPKSYKPDSDYKCPEMSEVLDAVD